MRVSHHNGLYQIRGQLRAVRFYTIDTAAATAAAAKTAAAENTVATATAAATAKTAALPNPRCMQARLL